MDAQNFCQAGYIDKQTNEAANLYHLELYYVQNNICKVQKNPKLFMFGQHLACYLHEIQNFSLVYCMVVDYGDCTTVRDDDK